MRKLIKFFEKIYTHIACNINKYALLLFVLLISVRTFAGDFDIDLSSDATSVQDLATKDGRKIVLLVGGLIGLIGSVISKSMWPILLVVASAIAYGLYLDLIVTTAS